MRENCQDEKKGMRPEEKAPNALHGGKLHRKISRMMNVMRSLQKPQNRTEIMGSLLPLMEEKYYDTL